MTDDKLTALAARLRDHASDYITHPDDACKHSDLLAASEYLRQCAEAEPVATVRVHNTGGNAGIAWSGVPTEHAGTMRGGTPLYTHPQPQQADVEDDSKWLGPFTTATEALNELRMSVATMMGADPNTWPDHGNAPLAIAAAFGIRQHAMELQSSAQADAVEALSDGATDVLSERRRQIDSEGWSAEHDDRRSDGSIAVAAVCYVLASLRAVQHGAPPEMWPWDRRWWKPSYGRHDLVKAGALILAEIDRIDRAVLAAQGGNDAE